MLKLHSFITINLSFCYRLNSTVYRQLLWMCNKFPSIIAYGNDFVEIMTTECFTKIKCLTLFCVTVIGISFIAYSVVISIYKWENGNCQLNCLLLNCGFVVEFFSFFPLFLTFNSKIKTWIQHQWWFTVVGTLDTIVPWSLCAIRRKSTQTIVDTTTCVRTCVRTCIQSPWIMRMIRHSVLIILALSAYYFKENRKCNRNFF